MPTWKISKIITDLVWLTLKEQLQTKLRSAVENREQWEDISERVRLALLQQLNHKKATHSKPKAIKNEESKQIKEQC